MKRFFVAVSILIASIGITMAATDTIHLKNGSVIKGEIIEQVPGKSIKIKTADGSLFVYSIDEVELISKEETPNPDSKGHKGLDFGFNTGVDVMSGGSSIPIDLMLSKRINKNISFGLGSGVNIPTGGGDVSIPIFLDLKGYYPLKSTKLTPFLDIQGGYVINTASDYTVGSGKYKVTVTPSDFIMASVMPGIRIPMSSRTDLDFGLGYMMYAPTSGGGKISNAFAMRLGLNFHKSTNPTQPSNPKPPVPTRNTGFEFGFDLYGAQDAGLNFLFGYRLSKKLSVDLGFGASTAMYGIDTNNSTYTFYSGEDATGNNIYEMEGTDYSGDTPGFFKLFLRGTYRFTTKKFSPYVAVDFGFRKTFGGDDKIQVNVLNHRLESLNNYCSGIFIRPSVGISWRCTNNSYLQLHADYEICNSGIKSHDVVYNVSGDIKWKLYKSMRFKYDGAKFSPFSVGITWTRTFGLFSRD